MNPLFAKAQRAATSAHRLAADGDYDGACDRAYYAIFNAIRALLEESGAMRADEAKTHASVLRLFSDQFVKTALVPRSVGKAVYFSQDLRSKADYSRAWASADDATDAMATMDTLLTFAVAYLGYSEGQSEGDQS